MSDVTVRGMGHAAVRFERDGQALVIDPGAWSGADAFDGVDAFLLTHEHVDHCDSERVAAALVSREHAEAWAPSPAADLLIKAGAPADRVHRVLPGVELVAAGFHVSTHGGVHATIHPMLPVVPNVGYLVDERVYHPGDSFAVPDSRSVEMLFLPVAAPWLSLSQSADFAAAVQPSLAVPIHDDILSDVGKEITDRMLTNILGSVSSATAYRRAAADSPVFSYSA